MDDNELALQLLSPSEFLEQSFDLADVTSITSISESDEPEDGDDEYCILDQSNIEFANYTRYAQQHGPNQVPNARLILTDGQVYIQFLTTTQPNEPILLHYGLDAEFTQDFVDITMPATVPHLVDDYELKLNLHDERDQETKETNDVFQSQTSDDTAKTISGTAIKTTSGTTVKTTSGTAIKTTSGTTVKVASDSATHATNTVEETIPLHGQAMNTCEMIDSDNECAYDAIIRDIEIMEEQKRNRSAMTNFDPLHQRDSLSNLREAIASVGARLQPFLPTPANIWIWLVSACLYLAMNAGTTATYIWVKRMYLVSIGAWGRNRCTSTKPSIGKWNREKKTPRHWLTPSNQEEVELPHRVYSWRSSSTGVKSSPGIVLALILMWIAMIIATSIFPAETIASPGTELGNLTTMIAPIAAPCIALASMRIQQSGGINHSPVFDDATDGTSVARWTEATKLKHVAEAILDEIIELDLDTNVLKAEQQALQYPTPLPDEDQQANVATGLDKSTKTETIDDRIYLDSGATIHVDKTKSGMQNFKRVVGMFLGTAQANARIAVSGIGDRVLGIIRFKDIRCVPNASKNLRSVSRLCDQADGTYEVLFTNDGFEVRSSSCTCECVVIGQGFRSRSGPDAGMYVHATDDQLPNQAHAAQDASDEANRGTHKHRVPEPLFEGATKMPPSTKQTAPQEKIRPTKLISMLHSAYGHLHLAALKTMHRAGVLTLTNKTGKHLHLTTDLDCQHCLAGKSHKGPVRKEGRRATKPGERLMADIRGPFKTESTRRSRFYLNIVDDFSGFTTVVPMRDKNDAQSAVLDYIAYTEKQGHQVVTFQSDNDGSIVNDHVKAMMAKKGITFDPSPPYRKEMNGSPERDHRTLNEGVKTLLHEAGMPLHFWEQALLTKNYVKNRTLKAPLPNYINAATVWFGEIGNHHTFVPFGCEAKALLYPEQKDKDDDNVEENMIMVGYASKGGYLLLRKNGHIVTRYGPDITFNATSFPYQRRQAAQQADDDEASDHDDSKEEKQEVLQPPRRSTRVTFRPSNFSHEELDARKTELILEEYNAGIALTLNEIDEFEPRTYQEAVTCASAIRWIAAIEEELQSHHINGTWELCALPAHRKTIGCKWVFKLKRDQNGNVVRYKARLTAKGYSQIYGIDYDETFAPTVRFSTIRCFFALTAKFSWDMTQLDVKTAYLIPDLPQEVYMKVPEGVDHKGAVLLKKCLYGLKNSGREWNQCLHKSLSKLGLTRSRLDPCLYYIMKNDVIQAMVIVYVDDILVGGSTATVKKVANQLKATFQMTQNDPDHFLGIRVERDKSNNIKLTQDAYTKRLLNNFNMTNAKPATTPATSARLTKDDCPKTLAEREEMSKVPYRQCIGALMYLAIHTRPDIAFAVNQASRFLQNPGKVHWTAVKHILAYLKGTPNHGLIFTSNSGSAPVIEGFSDADWATDKDDRRSYSGYAFFLFGNIISWRSKKQPTVALSTCEAELIALTLCMKEALFLRGILLELQLLSPKDAVLLHEDNQGALAIATDDSRSRSERTKHIDIKYFRVQEEVQEGHIEIDYCTTNAMVADMFTKPQEKLIFTRNKTLLKMFTPK
jgi:hypothetical protein